jgi:hypothetical protein
LKSQLDFATLTELYSLSLFWNNCVLCEAYSAAEEWTSILRFTHYGETTLQTLRPLLTEFGQGDVLLAYFLGFFHHELFLDSLNTDITSIRRILERELFQERLRLPHRFGRLLYDRFNDTYLHTRTEHLMSSEVDRLLQGTPIGVAQLGKFVSGPLGIIDSQENRWLPPNLDLPLWHCSDTGCEAMHEVTLGQPSVPVVRALSRISSTLFDRLGPRSEWSIVFVWESRGKAPRRYVDLPAFIADCVVGPERTALLAAALRGSRRDMLRKTLALPPRKERDAEGPADQVASRLGPEAQLQLLLTLPDQDLVSLVDDAVCSKAIKVPLGEIRELRYETPRGPKDSGSQLSALGIRSVRRDPVVNLTSAIWRAYTRLGLGNELEWRVRSDVAKSPYEALVAFVRNHGPAESIHELILTSARITAAVCEDLQVPLVYARGTDKSAIDRMLWKLGFNPMQFDDSIPRFKSRLAEFNETILVSTPIDTEDARERVRAAGVNVFVSLEDFLDRLISYNVWLLSSDHFLRRAKFSYSSVDARRSVAQALGTSLRSDGATLLWSVDGENPLGTLLRYLRATAYWIESLVGKERTNFRRPEQALPHFADDEHVPFPFRHVALWADTDPGELQRYAELYGRIAKLIEESQPAVVRNGLDHFREVERFPPADKLLACVARLGQALELADVHRFLPKVFWLSGQKSNRFGAVEYELRDYAERPVVAYGPPLVSGLEPILYEDPCLLAPGNLLGTPNSSLVFKLREQSEFSGYWQDYPRRRRIPPGNGKPGSTQLPDTSSAGT